MGRACAVPSGRVRRHGRETLPVLGSCDERAARPSDVHALRQVAAQVLGVLHGHVRLADQRGNLTGVAR